MNIKCLFDTFRCKQKKPPGRISFSQSGEDIIVSRTLARLKVAKPTYLDIGANDPVHLNNTYGLYQNGCHGVLVEPDPVLAGKLRRERPGDRVIACGIGAVEEDVVKRLYVFENSFFNTFSESEAKRILVADNSALQKEIDIRLRNINAVIAEYFDGCPNFISIDVEGIDLPVLQSFDFRRYRPEVFCVETISFDAQQRELKRSDIIEFMIGKGYLNFADTYINTIFVDKDKWLSRRSL